MNEKQFLQKEYQEALSRYESGQSPPPLNRKAQKFCKIISDHQEKPKGVLAVLMTLLLKKAHAPDQDIRMHQAGLPNGFSGRVLDTNVITPFLKEERFPYMASGSGWLTRSLEQAAPYDLNYPGKITPKEVRDAFLKIINCVQSEEIQAKDVLQCILTDLIKFRDRNAKIVLDKPIHLSVAQIVENVEKHYNTEIAGVARLPVIAIHSILSILSDELERYRDLQVMPLEEHTAPDTQSGLIGDIHITNSSGNICEAFEIKHNISVSEDLVNTIFAKFRTSSVERFYILTTHSSGEKHSLHELIKRIQQAHGCQLIVNGVSPTLKYYLRLVSSPVDFVNAYVTTIENDSAISYQLKQAWNDILGIQNP